jgi:hypothetical protein
LRASNAWKMTHEFCRPHLSRKATSLQVKPP